MEHNSSLVPTWVGDRAVVADRLRRKDDGRGSAWWHRLARLLALVRDLSGRTTPVTRDELHRARLAVDLALELRAALGSPLLLPADWATPELAPLDVLRTWGPCRLALDRAGARLADELDEPWSADDELACLLDDLLHALCRYRFDGLRALTPPAVWSPPPRSPWSCTARAGWNTLPYLSMVPAAPTRSAAQQQPDVSSVVAAPSGLGLAVTVASRAPPPR